MSQVVLATSRLEISPPSIQKTLLGQDTLQSHDTNPPASSKGLQQPRGSEHFLLSPIRVPLLAPSISYFPPLFPPPSSSPFISPRIARTMENGTSRRKRVDECYVDTSSPESMVVSGALIKYLWATLSRGQAAMTPGSEYVWPLFLSHATTSLNSSMHSCIIMLVSPFSNSLFI